MRPTAARHGIVLASWFQLFLFHSFVARTKPMPDRSPSRRQFLRRAGAALAAVPLARPAVAQSRLRDVTMRLDWVFQGPNAGFMVAHQKGFYKEAGLNVDIGPGKGSGSTAQLVASKATQFGFSDGFVVGNSVSKGLSIRTVAGIYRRNPTAAIVLADSDIKSPKDLEGKSIAITPGSAQFQQWPAFVKGCKIDPDKVRVVSIDPVGAPPALITGQVPAIAGFAQGQVPTVEIRGGKKVRLFWYADCGVTAVSNGIVVHTDFLKEEPELIRTFVAASLKGFLYGRAHPDELVAAVKAFSPTVEPAIVLREAELSWENWVTANTAGKPLGWMSDKDWEQTVEVLKAYGGVTGPLEASQLFTNDFVPTGNEFLPPPAETKKT
jgi:NitT/TauT family transport system substrate-binding protein